MFIFLYTVFRNSSISDEHVFCVALHFTTGHYFSILNDGIIYSIVMLPHYPPRCHFPSQQSCRN
ncbi:hypothetical protein C6A32_08630 [Streptococcus anginosus]|nr:hypothetical protein C6A32_08630 [Streptococcus anginosus]